MLVDSVRMLTQDGCGKSLRSVETDVQSTPIDFGFDETSSSNQYQIIYENNSKSNRIANLKTRYEKAKAEQGFIGDVADFFKNLFSTKNCSNNIEEALNKLNENSTEEEIQAVKKMIDKYSSNQDKTVNWTAVTGAALAGGAAGAKFGAAAGTAICPGLGTAGGVICGVLIGAIVGAVTCVTTHQVENMTDEVEGNSWQNDENIGKEALTGALAGGSAVLIKQIKIGTSNAVADKVGLSEVANGGKIAHVAIAEDGTLEVGSTIIKNIFAKGAGIGTGSALKHYMKQLLN